MDLYENCQTWERRKIIARIRQLYNEEKQHNIFEIRLQIIREFRVDVVDWTIMDIIENIER